MDTGGLAAGEIEGAAYVVVLGGRRLPDTGVEVLGTWLLLVWRVFGRYGFVFCVQVAGIGGVKQRWRSEAANLAAGNGANQA